MASTIQQFSEFQNDDGTYTFNLTDFTRIMSSTKHTKETKPKRPQSGYFLWLNSNRDAIKSEHFMDFDDTSNKDWTEEKYEEYYSSKELNLPEKDGKVNIKIGKKPKLVSLITAKAGKIWKNMSEDEKEPYMMDAAKLKLEYNEEKETSPALESPKKRGRPKKESKSNDQPKSNIDKSNDTKPVNNEIISDMDGEDGEDGEEMDVEEYEHNGKTYYINTDTGDIYDPEDEEPKVIAKVTNGEFKFI